MRMDEEVKAKMSLQCQLFTFFANQSAGWCLNMTLDISA